MNTCEYCGKESKRRIFCNNSHRSMFYRRLLANSKQPVKVLAKRKQMLAKGKQVGETLTEAEELKALDERIAISRAQALA